MNGGQWGAHAKWTSHAEKPSMTVTHFERSITPLFLYSLCFTIDIYTCIYVYMYICLCASHHHH